MRKIWWASAGLSLIGAVASLAVWHRVPDPMPIHWDAAGHADGWWPRWLGLLFAPVLGLILSAVIGFVCSRNAEARKVVGTVTLAIAGFHLGLHLLVAAYLGHAANGWNFTNKGGGYEFPVFWAIACFALAMMGSGANALRPDAGLRATS